jgi:hypothetical protein
VLVVLAGLSFLWQGWVFWLALLLVFGRLQDMPLDEITRLTAAQRLLAVGMVVIFLLVFTPVPLVVVS